MSTVYGKYRLIELISASPVAEVFKAKSHGVEGFEKMVAIKRLTSSAVAVPGYVPGFIEEAKAAVRLSHANLVQVFDLGHVQGSFYLAMEYVNGPDLDLLLRYGRSTSTPLPVDLAVHLASEVVKGLDYTHRRKDFRLNPLNLVHGGVHPWNIVVSRDGEVKLTNFGAHRLRSLLPEHMRPQDAQWNPFVAPEVLGGAAPDQRADIYAAGSVIHLLIAGYPAPRGSLDSRLTSNRDLPNGLVPILERALSREPGARYQRAGEMYEDLVAMMFHAGLKPNNRVLGTYVRELLEQGLPGGDVMASRARVPVVPHPPKPPQPPPRQPRVAPVVQADPSAAVPAIPDPAEEWRTLTPVERPRSVPDAGPSPHAGPSTPAPSPTAMDTSPHRDDTVEVDAPSPTFEEGPIPQAGHRGALVVFLLHDTDPRAGWEEIRGSVERWGGVLLSPEPDDVVLAVFPFDTLPTRSMMRAIHCALDLTDPAGEVAHYSAGVHSGVVEPDGEGVYWGDAASLALDLARQTQPGEVLASRVAPGMVANEFAFSPPIRLPSGQDAHRVDRFLSVTTQRSSLVARVGLTTPPAIRISGRDQELEVIEGLFERLMGGKGDTLVMEGPEGVGKSTLVAAVRRRYDTEDLAWFHVRLFPGFEQVPYWGLRALLGAISAVEEEDPVDRLQERLRRLVQLGLSPEELSAIYSVFSIPRRGSSTSRRISPTLGVLSSSDSKAVLSGILRKVTQGLSAEKPLVLVVEDMDHGDRQSLELFRELADHQDRYLLWLTSRARLELPEPSTRLVIGPPDREAMAVGLRRIAREYVSTRLGDAQVDGILDLAGDNPRHAEELVRYLAETDRLPGWRPEDDPVPPTFPDLVSSRLGLLSSREREVLQAAAVMGQLFGTGLLTRVVRMEPALVRQDIQRCILAGILEPIGPGLHAFRHTTYPAVLYGELSQEEARAIHERVALQIESTHPDDKARYLDELVHHFTRAGRADKALRYARPLSDRMAAGGHYDEAISCMAGLDDLLRRAKGVDNRARVEVLQKIGSLSISARDFPKAREALERALDLSQRTRQEREVARTLLLLGQTWLSEGNYREALDTLKRALRLAQGLRDRHLTADIYGALGETYNKNEDLQRAAEYLRRAIALSERAGDDRTALRLQLVLANAYAGTGDFKGARHALEKATNKAGRLADPLLRCAVLKTRSLVGFFEGDLDHALAACLEGADLAQDIGDVVEQVVFLHNAGDCYLRQGKLARSHHHFTRSLELSRLHGLDRYVVVNEILLGYLEALQGQKAGERDRMLAGKARVLRWLDEAVDAGLAWETIQGNLFTGKIDLALGNLDEAESRLTRAMTEAGRIHLKFAQEEAREALDELAKVRART